MSEQVDKDEAGQQVRGVAVDVFSGLGLGALLGVIVGLSVTPVVSVVVGAIAALLAVFLGLEGGNDDKPAGLGRVRLNGIRIGSFGFATVLGLMLGLFVRGSHLFDVPLDQHLARWDGFPTEVAQQMVVFERTGIVPRTLSFKEGEPGIEVELNEQANLVRANVLVSAFGDEELCDELDPGNWGNAPDRLLRRYEEFDKQLFTDIAARIRNLPDESAQLSMLRVVRQLICAMEEDPSE